MQQMAEHTEISAAPRRIMFDGATVFGLVGALALVGIAIAMGGSAAAFINIPALLIVLGGTLLVTTVSFSLSDMGHTLAAVSGTVFTRERDPEDVAYTTLELADFCRQHGVLKLQGAPLARFATEPFLHKILAMVIDGLPEKDVLDIIEEELAAVTARAGRAAAVLRKAAEVAPAMGLIGTLIGLVQMLGNLGDPSVIGPSMAVALLTTFYGALLANVVFNPLASKIEHHAAAEHLIQRLYALGVSSIARNENPRRLEILLNSALPPPKKVHYFE